MECAPLGWEQILSQGSLLVFWKRMNHSSSEALLQMPSKNLVTIRQMVSPDACSFLALPHAMYYRRLGTQQNSFPAESRLQTKDYFSNYLQNQGTTSISCPMKRAISSWESFCSSLEKPRQAIHDPAHNLKIFHRQHDQKFPASRHSLKCLHFQLGVSKSHEIIGCGCRPLAGCWKWVSRVSKSKDRKIRADHVSIKG